MKQDDKCIVEFAKEDMCTITEVAKDNKCWPHNKGSSQHGAL